jgi:hypothetical protein
MNGSSGQLAKAEIYVIDGSQQGQTIECMFRPKEYTLTKQNTWQTPQSKGTDVPSLEFSGGDSTSLTMDLFFDTYESGMDVRKQYTNRIWELMAIDSKLTDRTTAKGRPPTCEFRWGPVKSFKAVITSINQKFTMFKSDGTPVRTTLTVTFKEAQKLGQYPFQNPTTASEPGYKFRIIKEGDALDWIAYEEYGDSALWRLIADTNKLENPMNLVPGQVITIGPPP